IITSGIIVSIALLIMLVLSEVFDSFNVGNLISMKKRLKETNTDLDKCRKENEGLRNQLIAQINLIAKQSNTQNIILSDNYEKLLGVEKATNKDEQSEAIQKDDDVLENKTTNYKNDMHKRRLFMQGFESFAFEKLIDDLKIDKTKIFRDMQFKEGMIGIDPIMEKNIRFDGYYTNDDCDYFIEIKSRVLSFSDIYTTYYALNKIYFYRNAKNKNAKLILVLPIYDNDIKEFRIDTAKSFETMKNMFMPAISNNLLDIRPIYIDAKLYEKIIADEESKSSN
ncbi:MAG: hypothetical protein K2O35_03595, partial [Clostridia bacterium]|nr:hypothetical protein [Clostridia bacterium]